MHAGFGVAGGNRWLRCDPGQETVREGGLGKLFDGELIEGQIRVHGLDLIAIGPTVAIGRPEIRWNRIAGKINHCRAQCSPYRGEFRR